MLKKKQAFYKPLFHPLVRLNIQYFSDGGSGGAGGNGGNGGSGDPPPGGNDPTPPALTLDAVQAFVKDNPEGKTWLQSFADTRVTEAIKTYENKTLPKKLDEEIAKRYPAETEDQKKLRELQQQMDSLKNENLREALRNKALSVATEKNLPSKLVDFFIGKDEESTISNLGVLEDIFSTSVQQAVEARFKEGGRDPKPPGGNGETLTAAKIEAMSPEEINKNWDAVEKFLQSQQ
ncbi:DUF4355 domain-containing protein [Priestia megaterium]|uniref:DUF4355 domain-containing protein n=1 Tax=Priestia megaterium TaxID=1404 RepID=UPI00114F08A1